MRELFIILILFFSNSLGLNILQPKRALWKFISSKAKESIVERGKSIGVDFEGNVAELQSNIEVLESFYRGFVEGRVEEWPDYYLKAFHAYDDGNLSWEAAMEVESAALAVHAPIYTGTNAILRRDGDDTLRQTYHERLLDALNERSFIKPKTILDIGCSTGLSTVKLAETFPDADIVGVDLSPYMLAVASYQQEKTLDDGAARRIEYAYGSGGNLAPLLSGSIDLASMCLVSHELPESAATDIYREVFAVLKSGGVISVMDIDPESEFFLKFRRNRIAFSGFKSTEPHLESYIAMDLLGKMKEAGFRDITVAANSPRHRTITGWKP